MEQTTKPEPSAEDLARGYEIGKWHEHDNYNCLKCAYSTLWDNQMNEHIAAGIHIWSEPGKRGTSDIPEEVQQGRGPTY